MIYLPSIFFGSWLIISLKRYGVSVGSLMIFLYFITGLASVGIDYYNLYQYNVLNLGLGIIPPFVYCFLLWVCISPFQKLKCNKIKSVIVTNPKILDYCVYFYFAIFVLILVVAATRMNEILFHSSLAEVRQSQYSDGAESFYNHLSGIPRYICALSTFFLASSFFLILIFYYNVVQNRKSILFNIMTLCGSACQLLTSVMQADRSQIIYWLFLMLLGYLLFKGSIDRNVLKRFKIYIMPLVPVLFLYFLSVTISRWNEASDIGMLRGTLIYAGQNYINFCNFLQYCWDSPHSYCVLFPLSYLILGYESYFEWCLKVEQSIHIFTANFPTFLGIICSISGPIAMFLYVLFYRLLTFKFLRRRSIHVITFKELLKYWALAILPLIGLFSTFYLFYSGTIALIIWILVGKLVMRKRMRITIR